MAATPADPTRRAISWLLLAVAGPLLPVSAVLVSGRTLAWRDTGKLFAPMRTPITEALRGGRLPLWNPHEALGMPLLAQWLHGALHPVSVLATALPPVLQTDFMVAACVALAAGGAFLVARSLGASSPASALCGAAYGASGYLLGMSAVLQYLIAAASGPWTIAGLLLCARSPWAGVLAGSAAVAFQAFGGDPQWALVSVGLGMVLAVARGGPRALPWASLATALGMALAAVQLLPAWAFLGQTARQLGLTPAEQVQWALHPVRLLELVLPGLLAGTPGAAVAPLWASLEGPGARVPFVPSVHVGAVVLAMAIIGTRAGRPGRALAVAASVLAWMTLGHHLGARQLLGGVPVWGAIRYAEKLVGSLALALALLAALGTDRLASGGRAGLLGRVLGAIGLAALLGGATAFVSGGILGTRAGTGLVLAGVSVLAAAAAALVSSRTKREMLLPAALATVVLATSVASAVFAVRAGDRASVTVAPLLSPGAPGTPGPRIGSLADVQLLDPTADEWDRVAAVEARAGAPSFNVAWGLDQLSAYTGLNPVRFMTMMEGSAVELGPARWQFWRRYALNHVAVSDALAPAANPESSLAVAGGEPVARDERLGVTLFRVPHRPWASFAPLALPARDPSEAVRRAVGAWRAGSPAASVEGFAAPALATGTVLHTARDARSLEIEAEAGGPAFLVVNDAYWPGWRAWIDGQPAQVFPVDGVVRGVPWPPGRHVLVMRYEPDEVGWGVTLSLHALALWCAVALGPSLLPYLRRRRAEASA